MTNKDTIKKPTKTDNSGDVAKAFVRLRTVLDSLEVIALRYCLDNKDTTQILRRAKELEESLMPIIMKLQRELPKGVGGCPDGLFDCNGCCVSYPCREMFNSKILINS